MQALKLIAWSLPAVAALSCVVAHADPPTDNTPKPAEADRASQLLRTLRYYAISASGTQQAQDGSKMCLGGTQQLKLFRAIEEAVNDPGALAQLSKGCTAKTERRPDGSFRYAQDCEQTSGASVTSHFTIWGTPDDIHEHLEMVLKGLGPTAATPS